MKPIANSWIFDRTDGDCTENAPDSYKKLPKEQCERALRMKKIENMRDQKDFEAELSEVWD